MDFTEAPEHYQDMIIEIIEDETGEVFDWDNQKHMDMAQEHMADNLSD